MAQRRTVRFSSSEEITKQISFCDEDCETKSTLARNAGGGRKRSRQHVGEAHDAGSAHGDHGDVADRGERLHAAVLDLPRAVIWVPGFSGAKLLRIHTGTPAAVTGRRVLGCSTFAPK